MNLDHVDQFDMSGAGAGSVIGPRSARLGCLVRERNGP